MRPLAFRQVDHSLRAVGKQLRAALRMANNHAAKLVARGKYEEAQSAVELARAALRFMDRFESVIADWQDSSGRPSGKKGPTKVPLWRFYVIVARTLLGLGGEGSLQEVTTNIETSASAYPTWQGSLGASLTELEWKRAVGKARGPMQQHGYIESAGHGRWKLTILGRELAERRET